MVWWNIILVQDRRKLIIIKVSDVVLDGKFNDVSQSIQAEKKFMKQKM